MSEPAIFALDHVSFSYPPDHAVLANASFGLEEGRHVGLYGPNGSGKTTFFRLALGLITPDEGQLLFHGQPVREEKDLRALRRAVGLVLQNADDQLFCPTVLDDVAFGPLNQGLTEVQARQRAERTLAELGLEGFGPRLTHRLSGGEKKLVSLATVLSMRPEALLLDEPTNDLDPEARERLIAVLTSLKTARIIISHDWDFLARTSDTFLTIADKKLTSAAPSLAHTHVHAHPLGDTPHAHSR